MEKGKNTVGGKDTASPVVTTENVDGKIEESKGLSLRDALEVAVIATKEPEKDKKDERTDKSSSPKTTEGPAETPAVGAEPSGTEVGNTKQGGGDDAGLEPPAEYTLDEKADFMQLSRKGQEAQLRLDRSRKTKIEEIKAASAELTWSRDLARELTPYLKSVGEKMPTHEALIKALKMRNEFETGNPKQAAAAYLKAKGIEPPAELLAEDSEATASPAITTLQEQVNALSSKIAQDERAKTAASLGSIWQSFEQEKNAGGKPKYPDILGTSEPVLKLSAAIGSLVRGDTELSRQFIAHAQSRIPGLTYPKLLEEAYKYSGGKVDSSEASRTQDTQKHIAKSSRAASSVPGRGSSSTSSGPEKKFKTYREAAAAALAELKEAEG